MDRPHEDDNKDKQPQTETPTDEQLLNQQTIHKLAPMEDEEHRDDVHATLRVTNTPSRKLHKDKGEQSVLSVNMVNGNIDLQFKDTDIPALIDTGATISCMREGLASTLSKLVPTEFIRVRLRIYLADGAMCHISKAVKIKFKIQNRTFNHQFALLPKLTQPIVIGTDFLSKTKSTIQYSSDPSPVAQPIRAVRSITIPPFTERAITGQVTCYNSVEEITGVTDNLDRDMKLAQYLVQRSVVTPDDKNRHSLILMNISSRTCRIRKGEIIAVYTETKVDKDTGIVDTQLESSTPTEDTIDTEENSSTNDTESNTGLDRTFLCPHQHTQNTLNQIVTTQ